MYINSLFKHDFALYLKVPKSLMKVLNPPQTKEPEQPWTVPVETERVCEEVPQTKCTVNRKLYKVRQQPMLDSNLRIPTGKSGGPKPAFSGSLKWHKPSRPNHVHELLAHLVDKSYFFSFPPQKFTRSMGDNGWSDKG